MDRYLIEEEVKREINNLITEELTVSNEVLKASDEVEKYILANIQKQKVESFCNGGGKRQLSFQLYVFDGQVKVNFMVTNYNFKDSSYFNSYRKKYDIDMSSGSTFKKSRKKSFAIFYLNYASIGFKPIAKFREDLHHELNHILQQYKEGESYPDSEKYTRISTGIFSENETERDVAEILYLCNPTEQDSFASSVYSFVKYHYLNDMNDRDIDYYIKQTDAYIKVCRLKELFYKIRNDKPKYREIVLKHHNFKRWDRFEKRVRNAEHRFEEKLAMAIKKCKKDFVVYEQNTWCEATLAKSIYLLW